MNAGRARRYQRTFQARRRAVSGTWSRSIPAMSTIDAALRAARARIDGADAELLLAHVLGRPRGWLYAHAGDALPGQVLEAFQALVSRRAAGEPAAYLTGRRGFRDFDLAVDAATLVPRPETELLVEAALERLPVDAATDVLDLGTGSGAIALAIARERPRARVLATDASDAALDVARRNAATLGVCNVAFVQGDWWTPVAGRRFALVASNPPYIAEGDPHLADLRHEPRSALVSGRDGLDAIRTIADGAPGHLVPGGWLLLEHGWTQGPAVCARLEAAGLRAVETLADLEGRDRVTVGCLPGDARASSA